MNNYPMKKNWTDHCEDDSVQEKIRQRDNPHWREHLKRHKELLRKGNLTSSSVKWALRGG